MNRENGTPGIMRIGEEISYSLDTRATGVNNNVLVVGSSGSGKTTGVVIPNLLQMEGSYVISDPKGNLHRKYASVLKGHGYSVKKLSFIHPQDSEHYNFFRYIHSRQDIMKIAHMLVGGDNHHSLDPFWDDMGEILFASILAYIYENCPKKFWTMENAAKLLDACDCDVRQDVSAMDKIMERAESQSSRSMAVRLYKKFRCGAEKTRKSVLITTFGHIAFMDSPDICRMMETDTINIPSIGKRKTALFVEISDTDRSLDRLANLFFTQAIQELCRYADEECEDNRLPVPVRFFLDDFATNCRIEDFPRMIASIRSREISTVLMIQAESQLTQLYGHDGRTIIGNCDTYVYLGGNDLDTARAVSERSDRPLNGILNMPVGDMWIFRRGEAPLNRRLIRDFSPRKSKKEQVCSGRERREKEWGFTPERDY